jgi:hypothetical protein
MIPDFANAEMTIKLNLLPVVGYFKKKSIKSVKYIKLPDFFLIVHRANTTAQN